MVLVILGHINFANQAIKSWIYAFHMPAFFFASGLLLKNRPVSNISECWGILWKRFQSLMFPYFIWALIYTSFNASNLIRILYGSHQSLRSANTLSSLWFLPVLFEATGLFVFSQLVFKERLNVPVKLFLVAVSLGIAMVLPKFRHGYPWCLDVSFAAFGFLLIGNLLFPFIQRIQRVGCVSRKGVTLWFLIAFLAFAGSLLYYLNTPKLGIILMADARYGNFLLFALVACLGIVSVLFASILLDYFFPQNFPVKFDILSFLGKNTLCVFVVHKPIIKMFKSIFLRFSVPDGIALIVTCAGTVAGCCLIALFINRHFPEMVGKHAQTAASN